MNFQSASVTFCKNCQQKPNEIILLKWTSSVKSIGICKWTRTLHWDVISMQGVSRTWNEQFESRVELTKGISAPSYRYPANIGGSSEISSPTAKFKVNSCHSQWNLFVIDFPEKESRNYFARAYQAFLLLL